LTCKRFDLKEYRCKKHPYVKVDKSISKEKFFLYFGSCKDWLKHHELYKKARDEEIKTGDTNDFFNNWEKTIKDMKC